MDGHSNSSGSRQSGQGGPSGQSNNGTAEMTNPSAGGLPNSQQNQQNLPNRPPSARQYPVTPANNQQSSGSMSSLSHLYQQQQSAPVGQYPQSQAQGFIATTSSSLQPMTSHHNAQVHHPQMFQPQRPQRTWVQQASQVSSAGATPGYQPLTHQSYAPTSASQMPAITASALPNSTGWGWLNRDSAQQLNPATGIQQSSQAGGLAAAGQVPVRMQGPPMKPKQSGFALWVGNIPMSATVVDLKDHFSRGASKSIESVKYIAKTRCAFVNYISHEACAAALDRFNGSAFHGINLVCRLRKRHPTAPEAPHKKQIDGKNIEDSASAPESSTQQQDLEEAMRANSHAARRYFIMKSLTVEELQAAERDLKWATQEHNGPRLNQAFETAEIVYLIFSANRSGEYYGLARMASRIKSSTTRPTNAPNSQTGSVTAESLGTTDASFQARLSTESQFTKTPSSEFAPKGRIFDDHERKIVFWEASSSDGSRSSSSTVTPIDSLHKGGSSAGKVAMTTLPRPYGSRTRPDQHKEQSSARETREKETGMASVEGVLHQHDERSVAGKSNHEKSDSSIDGAMDEHKERSLASEFGKERAKYPIDEGDIIDGVDGGLSEEETSASPITNHDQPLIVSSQSSTTHATSKYASAEESSGFETGGKTSITSLGLMDRNEFDIE